MSESANTGHRQRLRDRFVAGEENSRSDEALLELLLSYAIPQQDVQPLARKLLAEFGGLANVLAAEQEALCRVRGVKANTAVLLKAVDWIRTRGGAPESAKAAPKEPKAGQATLFDLPPEADAPPAKEKTPPVPRRGAVPRRGSELFSNAVLKEAIALLPDLPDTDSLDEAREHLRGALHYSGEQTRQRFASYIARRMFPQGDADRALRHFARAFKGRPALSDVCFYRFLKSEPLELQVVEEVLLPRIGVGRLKREALRAYLAGKFPSKGNVKDCAQAASEALRAAGIAHVDRQSITFGYRDVSIPAFAFVLHSEFPEPGMFDIAKVETNRAIRAMLWNPTRILPSLYELRNQGIISKVSEIDTVRQFTTKWTLDEVVEHLAAGGNKR